MNSAVAGVFSTMLIMTAVRFLVGVTHCLTSSMIAAGVVLDFDGVPQNEYEYSVKRDAMLQAEKEYEGQTIKLNEVSIRK